MILTILELSSTKSAQVAQSEGGTRLRNVTVWVRIPPRVQEDAGECYIIPQKVSETPPALNGEYGATVALQSSKLKVLVRVRLLAQGGERGERVGVERG